MTPTSEPVSTAIVRAQKTDPKRAQIAALMQQAAALGFVCDSVDEIRLELATAITTRMILPKGEMVYQASTFDLPGFNRQAAEKLLPEELITFQDTTTVTWTMDTFNRLSTGLSSVLAASPHITAGISRALKTEAETVVRVLAVLTKAEISHVKLPRGQKKLSAALP